MCLRHWRVPHSRSVSVAVSELICGVVYEGRRADQRGRCLHNRAARSPAAGNNARPYTLQTARPALRGEQGVQAPAGIRSVPCIRGYAGINED